MMTKVWILSDLHIDANPDLDLDAHPDCDVIAMAGDLADGTHNVTPWLLSEFSDDERTKLILVPGNHEYYGVGMTVGRDRLAATAETTGIVVLDNGVVEVANQRSVGSTLWSQDEWRRLRSEAVAFLNETVQTGDVVITQHAPSYEGRDIEMQRNIRKVVFSSAYASRLDDRIEAWAPALVIHGHAHIKPGYVIGAVRVESMARGRGWGATGFKSDCVVELDDYEPKLQP